MRTRLLACILALPLLNSCGGSSDPAPFADSSSRNRKSQGNAEVQGPGAGDLIRQSRRDYYRERHDERRYYGNY